MAALTIQDLFDKGTVYYLPRSNKDQRRNLQVFLEGLAKLIKGDIHVSAGWFSEQHYDNGESIADVARANEYGYFGVYEYDVPAGWRGQPFGRKARPFMRPAFDNNAVKWVHIVGEGVKKELAKGDKGNLKKPFEKAGLQMQRDIQDAIKAVTTPIHLAAIYARAVRKGVLPDHPPSSPDNKSPDWFFKKLTDGEKQILLELAADTRNFSKPLEDTGEMFNSVAYKVTGGIAAK